MEVLSQQGLGRATPPIKAAFDWHAKRWVGLIRLFQTAKASTKKGQLGTDERVHVAQLIIVPATHPSWGSGLYVRPDISSDAVKKATAQFTALKTPNPLLLKALDFGSKYEFGIPSESAVQAMKKSLKTSP